MTCAPKEAGIIIAWNTNLRAVSLQRLSTLELIAEHRMLQGDHSAEDPGFPRAVGRLYGLIECFFGMASQMFHEERPVAMPRA
jgi:hypothetical protein